MVVNSAFTGFFSNRLVIIPGIATGMLAIFFITSSFTRHPDPGIREKEVNLIIREIGHRLLLQAGDSTSRILPVTEKEGTFLLRFENKLVFNHDSLWLLSQSLLPKTEFPSGYTVTVNDCKKGEIIYGFQVNNTTPDILPCLGRNQPEGCYTMEFSFADFYENMDQKSAEMDQRTNEVKSIKVGPQEPNPKIAELKAKTPDNNTYQLNNELKSTKVDPQEVQPNREESKTVMFDYPLMNVVYPSLLVLLVVTVLIGRFGKRLKNLSNQNQNQNLIKESVPELAVLGKFLFNVKDQRLILGSEVISLTDKECKVLELLHKNFGELISRETLMQEIWINEGVITGRSLDMFVSKLRKKLSSDPGLRISNVHGKGYKLEMI